MSKTRHTPADEPFFILRCAAGGMPHGAEIAPHAHDWHQLTFARRGVISVRTDRGAWAVPPGSAVWAAARTPHSISFHGACDYIALYVRRRRGLPPASAVVAISELMKALIERAAAIGMLDRRIAEHRAMAQLIHAELACNVTPMLSLVLPHSNELRAVAEDLLAAGAAGDIGEVARRHGFSRRSIERRFPAETGLSFGRWRRHGRLLTAILRLGQDASVTEAAHAAGYRSPSAFIAAFSAVFAMTPGRMFDAGRRAEGPSGAQKYERPRSSG